MAWHEVEIIWHGMGPYYFPCQISTTETSARLVTLSVDCFLVCFFLICVLKNRSPCNSQKGIVK